MKTYIIHRRIYSSDGEYNDLPDDIVRAESAKQAFINVYGSPDENGDPCWDGSLHKCEFDSRDKPIVGDEIGPHDDDDRWLGEGEIEGVPIYWDECQSQGFLMIWEVTPAKAALFLEHYRPIVAALEAAL